jgi:transketolase
MNTIFIERALLLSSWQGVEKKPRIIIFKTNIKRGMDNMEKSNGYSPGISREEFEHKMDFFELKMEHLERKIGQKADEVVAIQLLQHRRELDEIYQAIQRIDEHIIQIDQELDAFNKGKLHKEKAL